MPPASTAAKPERGRTPPFLPLTLDEAESAAPKSRQIYDQIRGLVLSGHLAAGMRVPSSRNLARELGCARNTVIGAYEQLLAEGYLSGAHGSGTYVAQVLPDQFLAVGARSAPTRGASGAANEPKLSRRGADLAGPDIQDRGPRGAFMLGPDTTLFPFDTWARILGRTWRRPDGRSLGYGDPAGHRSLREAIADHVRAARGLRCTWEQVLITSGVQQGLDLAVRALLDPGEAVWCEDPGYRGFRGPLLAADAKLVPVPLDGEGLSLAAGRKLAPQARLAVVAPSHQFPLGTVMSLARRLELLDWARASDAWILEDDYDSEYRYAGRPLAALQGLDAARDAGANRVLYAGSFSKVMFPALRIGYLIVPEGLAAPLTRARAALDDQPSAIAQPALAAFIGEGHFAGHIRRMRGRYAARQEALLDAAAKHLQDLLVLNRDEAGMHLVAYLAPNLAKRMSDRAAEARAKAAGIATTALSRYAIKAKTAPGLLLGYAAVPEDKIEASVRALASALKG